MKNQIYVIIKIVFFLVSLFLGTPFLSAKIFLPQLISDRMVLQRDTELEIWGWADSNERITVRFNGKYYDTEPNEEGKWSITMPPQKAGGPFIMEINEIIIRDILIGDVWLCSGQSNQETPIARLVDMFPEINVSNNHMIRHYKVPTQNIIGETKEKILGNAQWHSAIASDVMNWTALAYFFAQEAYEHTKVPVGMLVSSLGGSSIESWISQEHLKEFPQRVLDKTILEELKYLEKDKGEGKWLRKNWDDLDWETMEIPCKWKDYGVTTKGVVWYRKNIDLPASMDRKHAKLYLGTLVDSDSVFVNGNFIGCTSYMYPPRKYDIPAGILRQGKNNITVRLVSNSGMGEFISDKPYKIVGDDVEINLTGEWKYKVGKDQEKLEDYSSRLPNINEIGSGLYNGMIYPIRDYKVKGTIWYQGESNAGRSEEYGSLLQSLITNWRELWKMSKMPFLLVQLPNFMPKSKEPTESGWAKIREAQFKTVLNVPNTALAVTYDVGEWNDIHPLNKKDVAHRLFLGARKIVYGEELVSSGPMYKEMKIDKDKIIISFTETGSGLICKGESLKHFAIAGNDRVFVWANAKIKGNKVIVNNPNIQNPVAVRYAWANNPEDANLYNKEGLLASPFRTDDW